MRQLLQEQMLLCMEGMILSLQLQLALLLCQQLAAQQRRPLLHLLACASSGSIARARALLTCRQACCSMFIL